VRGVLAIIASLLLCATTFAQEPRSLRLDPAFERPGDRVLFRVWDFTTNAWSELLSEGMLNEFSKGTFQPTVGPRVPKFVRINNVWMPNPKWEDTIPPPMVNLVLRYYAGNALLARFEVTEETHSPELLIRSRLASLWEGGLEPEQLEAVTEILWEQVRPDDDEIVLAKLAELQASPEVTEYVRGLTRELRVVRGGKVER
jgi:hypothetical protein